MHLFIYADFVDNNTKMTQVGFQTELEHGQKLCDILKLSKFSIFYKKWNNSWTKSWMNMKFQLSLYLIIPQSLEFQFIF